MTQNDSNNDTSPSNALDLSALANTHEEGGEFDGLDFIPPSQMPKRKSRLPLLLFLAIVIVGSTYGAYTVFLGGSLGGSLDGDMPRTIDVAPVETTTDTAAVEQPAEQALPEAVQEVPAADANTVTSDALPEPVAAVAPVTADITAETVAAATPTEAVPEAVKEEVKEEKAAEKAPAPEAEKDVAEKPTETAAPVVPEASPAPAVVPAPPAPPVVAAPTEQLKPVETVAPAPAAPLPVAAPAPAPEVAKNVADKMQAINDILGQEAIVSPDIKAAQDQAMMAPAEVTPRAKQVIIVKRSYGSDSAQAVVAAGDRVLDAGQYTDAVNLYDRQLRKNPSDPMALVGKATALQKAGRFDEAMRVYDRLLDLNPRDVEALTNYLGLLQKQNPQQALSRLRALSEQYPENPSVTGQLGMVQAQLLDTPNALRNFQKAMALDATNPVYAFNIGVLYDRLGNSEKARDAYRQALDIAGAYPQKARSVPLDTIRARLGNMGG